MKVQFHGPKTIDGKHFAKGVHEAPDALADHWFFKGLVAAKEVTVFPAPPQELAEKPPEEAPVALDKKPSKKSSR